MRSFPEWAVELRLCEIRARLLQDLIGRAQFLVLTLQGFQTCLLLAGQPIAFAGIALSLLTPDSETVRRAAELWRDRVVGRVVTGVIRAMVFIKPNAAGAKLSRCTSGVIFSSP